MRDAFTKPKNVFLFVKYGFVKSPFYATYGRDEVHSISKKKYVIKETYAMLVLETDHTRRWYLDFRNRCKR